MAEVINGNRDYSFDSPSKDFEGLANGLNVMLARLLGRPDPSDDELGTERRRLGRALGRRAVGRRVDDGAADVAGAGGAGRGARGGLPPAHLRRVRRGAQADQRRHRGADPRRLRRQAQAERSGAEEEARRAAGALQGRRQGRADDAQAVSDPVASRRLPRRPAYHRPWAHPRCGCCTTRHRICRSWSVWACSAVWRCGAGVAAGATGALLIAIAAGIRVLDSGFAIYNVWLHDERPPGKICRGSPPSASWRRWGRSSPSVLFTVGVALVLRRLPARAR